MNKALEDMLRPYAPVTPLDWEQATREIVQEIALLGFWRSGFFEQASFYGGTALRIFHGLNRFSEDLDFSLASPSDQTRLEAALASLQTELAAWGFSFEAEPKSSGKRTAIESAFLKGNTRINLLNVGVPTELSRHFPTSQKLTIKLELDTRPPPFAGTEVKTHLMPTPFQVRLYDLPSLFAGKLHALLFRGWKSRVKGRDFYDFVWFVGRRVPVNLPHLAARIRQSGNPASDHLNLKTLRTLLHERFETVNLAAAADEVRPFLRDTRELSLWSAAFFKELANRLTSQ
ncbi:MAG: nucleotidyl transferase AbiEii/AbiGii toxin family protein [Kiritimatiellia bacterium]|jgi:predicted nucleotidyltransferase component of viral defense system|nr:nucleotidyl transferase AbiEii/AbiGii toxin family protein [Kiritimatiellia bacterium]HQG75341.1 nucleotidyl transferase AbiEii/AbiGii toxin family protein [Kiritimatiellia bacterium]